MPLVVVDGKDSFSLLAFFLLLANAETCVARVVSHLLLDLQGLCLVHYSTFQSSSLPSVILIPLVSALPEYTGCVCVPAISV